MARTFIVTGAVLAAAAVAIGAFGAHGLAAHLAQTDRAATFDTAVQYHQFGALSLVLVGLLAPRMRPRGAQAGWLILAGVLLFSGALYALAILDLGFMGAVAPFGGAAFIAGWALVALDAWRVAPGATPD
jgi:uncharacterized membrane protein YgdD (TMEM256/DUF423 family)